MSKIEFKLPDVGEGIVEAEIVAWHIKEGDTIKEDAPLIDVMTDKATVEIQSPTSGLVQKINGSVGETMAIGSVIVIFESERHETIQNETDTNSFTKTNAENTERCDATPNELAMEETANSKALASPSVRNKARNKAINLSLIKGSGRAGRVLHKDLEEHLKNSSHEDDLPNNTDETIKKIKVTGLRRIIADKMVLSKRSIPHYSYIEEIDVTDLEHFRIQMNSIKTPEQTKLTLLPFIMKAMAKAIIHFPECNAHYDEQEKIITQFSKLHIGIATQTDSGLKVPVVHNCHELDIWQMATQVKRISQAARLNKASITELTGSSITITSLGKLGGIATTPVINHPEVAIVGVNKMVERPVVLEGEIEIRKMMNISASFDHRVVDGYQAAEFVQKIKAMLELPATIFM